MDLFSSVQIGSLSFGDLFKFGNDCFFPYRFIECLCNVDGVLLYNIRRCEYTVFPDTSRIVYLLTDEEKERIKFYY